MMAIQQQKMSVAHFTGATLFEQQTSDIWGLKRQQRPSFPLERNNRFGQTAPHAIQMMAAQGK